MVKEQVATTREEARFVVSDDSGWINKDLSIKKVVLYQPTQKQLNVGIIAPMVVETGLGEIKLTVFESKERQGELYLKAPQTKAIVGGMVKYYDDVRLHPEAEKVLLSLLDNYVEKESVERVRLK